MINQTENNITLMWEKVNNISTYFLTYANNGSFGEIKINESHEEVSVSYEVSSLTAGTKYMFTVFTAFEEVNSTGHKFAAVTSKWLLNIHLQSGRPTSVFIINHFNTFPLAKLNLQ